MPADCLFCGIADGETSMTLARTKMPPIPAPTATRARPIGTRAATTANATAVDVGSGDGYCDGSGVVCSVGTGDPTGSSDGGAAMTSRCFSERVWNS